VIKKLILVLLLTIVGGLANANPPGTFQPLLLSGNYIGPGDIVAGATSWWGLRGYNTAFSGAAINLCLPLDTHCEDENISNGNLVLGAFGSTCNNSTVICTIKQFYDQTGNGNHAVQSTIANRAAFVINCINTSYPCASFLGSSSQQYKTSGNISISQPVSVSTFVYRASTNAVNNTIWVGGFSSAVNDAYFVSSSANIQLLGTSTVSSSVAASSATWHALQLVFNGSSSVVRVDASDTTGLVIDAGSTTQQIGIAANVGGNFLTGNMVESGNWPLSFNSGQRSNIEANQCTYWRIAC